MSYCIRSGRTSKIEARNANGVGKNGYEIGNGTGSGTETGARS